MTLVMGILNITPDSFSNDGVLNLEEIVKRIEKIVTDGADIIDIGAESTRPTAVSISLEEEIKRITTVLKLFKDIPIPISVDTTKSKVAEIALKYGATYINDVSGMRLDKNMKYVIKGSKVILMHSARDRENTGFKSKKIDDIKKNFEILISAAKGASEIILDPGIGFGDTPLESIDIIKNLNYIKDLGYKVLIGASKKSFIGKLTGASINERIGASICSHIMASLYGTDIVRVHDVFETKQALSILKLIQNSNQNIT